MRNDVLLGMTMALIGKNYYIKDLAQKFDISVRTAYRYISVLESSGIPIVNIKGKRGYFGVLDTLKIDKSYFSATEYDYLLKLLDGTMPPFENKLHSIIMDKLQALQQSSLLDNIPLESSTLVIDNSSWSGGSELVNKLKVLNQGISSHICLTIDYYSSINQHTLRTIQPHVIVYKDGVWYVYAYCLLRNDWRMFCISRMRKVYITDLHFEPKQYDEKLAPWHNMPKQDLQKVKLKVSPNNFSQAIEWLGENCFDNYTADVYLPINNITLSKILSFGDGLEIIEPQELKNLVIEKLNNALKNY